MAKSIWEMDFKDGVTSAVQAMKSQVAAAFGSMNTQEKGFEKGMQSAAQSTTNVSKAAGQMDKQVSSSLEHMAKSAEKTAQATEKIKESAGHAQDFSKHVQGAGHSTHDLAGTLMHAAEAAGVLFAVEKVTEWGEKILDVTAEMEGYTNRVAFASIDTEDSVKNLKFLKDEVKDLHLPIKQVYEGFSEMEAGLKGFVEGDSLRGLSNGVFTAAATLHLGNAELSRTLYDFKEIGERGLSMKYESSLAGNLPGINSVVKQAFGKSMHELQEGGMSGTEFLKKLGPALTEYFKGGLSNWSNSLQAKMNDTANAMYEKQVELGEKLKPVYLAIMGGLTDVISVAGDGIINSFDWVKDHTKDIRSEMSQIAIEMRGMFGGLGDFFKPLLGPINEFIHSVWNGFKNWIGPITQFKDQFVGVMGFVRDALGGVISFYGKYIETMFTFFGGLVDVMHTLYVFLEKIYVIDIVIGVFQGLWETIKDLGDLFGWIYDHTLKPIFDGIGWVYGKIKDLLGIKSGFSLTHGAGSDWGDPEIKDPTHKKYNPAAGGEEAGKEKKEGSNHRSVTVTIHKLVGIENVYVASPEEAYKLSANAVTTSTIGAVRDVETGVAQSA